MEAPMRVGAKVVDLVVLDVIPSSDNVCGRELWRTQKGNSSED